MDIVKWICYPFVTGLSTVIYVYCFLEMYKLYKLVWAGCDTSHTVKEINQSIKQFFSSTQVEKCQISITFEY